MRSSIADAERVKDCLLTVRFCQGLAPEQIAAMASEFRVRLFEAGETIALAGEPGVNLSRS